MTDNNGDGKFLGHLRRNWHVIGSSLVLAFTIGIWVSQIETSETRNARLSRTLGPLRTQVDHTGEMLEQHRDRPGHPEVMARVVGLEKVVGEIRTDVKELLRRTSGNN